MESGTKHAPQPQHNPPLAKHFHEEGGFKMTPQQRKDYAEKNFDEANCKNCQTKEGGTMAAYSRSKNKEVSKNPESSANTSAKNSESNNSTSKGKGNVGGADD
jgi:hypothetical protein